MAMTLQEKRARRAERKASEERMKKSKEEAIEYVKRGTCPVCGEKLYRNLALTGWWVCGSRGEDGFRRDGKTSVEKPSCYFQCFTD
jgi:hypothetical protein